MNIKNEIKFLISGDNGGWLLARKEQIDAYFAFLSQDLVSELKFTVSTGNYYMVRSRTVGQSNSWVEIQDRSGERKWRLIKQLELSPNPVN